MISHVCIGLFDTLSFAFCFHFKKTTNPLGLAAARSVAFGATPTTLLGTNVQEQEVSPRTNSVCLPIRDRAHFSLRVPTTGCDSSAAQRSRCWCWFQLRIPVTRDALHNVGMWVISYALCDLCLVVHAHTHTHCLATMCLLRRVRVHRRRGLHC